MSDKISSNVKTCFIVARRSKIKDSDGEGFFFLLHPFLRVLSQMEDIFPPSESGGGLLSAAANLVVKEDSKFTIFFIFFPGGEREISFFVFTTPSYSEGFTKGWKKRFGVQ